MKRCLHLIAGLLVVIGLSSGAQAQTLDMDYSWFLQSELQAQQMSNWYANAAAQSWLNYCNQQRAAGYWGPIQPLVTPADFSRTVREGQAAWDGYIQQGQINSQRTDAALSNYSQQAIQGQAPYYNPASGQAYWLPYQNNQYYQDYQTGQVYYNNGYQTPDPNTYQPLNPLW